MGKHVFYWYKNLEKILLEIEKVINILTEVSEKKLYIGSPGTNKWNAWGHGVHSNRVCWVHLNWGHWVHLNQSSLGISKMLRIEITIKTFKGFIFQGGNFQEKNPNI